MNDEGSKNFEAQLKVRAKAGNLLDIADIPQPGLLKTWSTTATSWAAPAADVGQCRRELERRLEGIRKPFLMGPSKCGTSGCDVKSFVVVLPTMFADNGLGTVRRRGLSRR